MKRFLSVLMLFIASLAPAQTNIARMFSGVNTQTTFPYTISANDETKLTVFSSAVAFNVNLPAGTTDGFGAGNVYSVENQGPGTGTILCSGCTVNSNGVIASSMTLNPGQGGELYSDGLNFVFVGATNSGAFSGTPGQIVLNNGVASLASPTIFPSDIVVPGTGTFGTGAAPSAQVVTVLLGAIGLPDDPICQFVMQSPQGQLCKSGNDLLWNPGGAGQVKQALLPVEPYNIPLSGATVGYNTSTGRFQVGAPIDLVALGVAAFPSTGVKYNHVITINDPTQGSGTFVCNNKNDCINTLELTKIGNGFLGGAALGTISPTSNLSKIGDGTLHLKGLLAANNLSNVNNLCVHKELTTPTYFNVTADPGTHYQPLESCVFFPNINGPGDDIPVDFYFICTTCSSNSTNIQFRLSDPSTACTLNSSSIVAGASGQIWRGTAHIITNGSVNGATANIDLLMHDACGGTTCSAPQKTSTCAVNMGGGYAIGLDILVQSTNAAVIDTWTPYMVTNTTRF